MLIRHDVVSRKSITFARLVCIFYSSTHLIYRTIFSEFIFEISIYFCLFAFLICSFLICSLISVSQTVLSVTISFLVYQYFVFEISFYFIILYFVKACFFCTYSNLYLWSYFRNISYCLSTSFLICSLILVSETYAWFHFYFCLSICLFYFNSQFLLSSLY